MKVNVVDNYSIHKHKVFVIFMVVLTFIYFAFWSAGLNSVLISIEEMYTEHLEVCILISAFYFGSMLFMIVGSLLCLFCKSDSHKLHDEWKSVEPIIGVGGDAGDYSLGTLSNYIRFKAQRVFSSDVDKVTIKIEQRYVVIMVPTSLTIKDGRIV